MKSLAWIEKWWKNGLSASSGPVPYEIVCTCKLHHQGYRQARHQVIRCTQCGNELFVLPKSPLPRVAPLGSEEAVPLPQAPPPRLRPWLVPVVAGGGTLIVALGLLIIIFSRFLPGPGSTVSGTASADDLDRRVANGRKALREGDFRRAVDELEAVRSILGQQPKALSTAETRQVNQLYRQAVVLVDWPRERLELALVRAAALPDDEWKALIQRQLGKTFVFDADVRRDAAGRYEVKLRRPIEGLLLRFDLQNMAMLRHLPLDAPQRLLFAARLDQVSRDPAGAVIRLQPDSGVLLTDIGPSVLTGTPVADNELQAILAQQRRWLEEMP